MLIRLFRQNQPIVLLLLLVVLAALWPGAAPLLADPFVAMPVGMPLYGPVHRLLAQGPWVFIGVGGLLVLALSFQLNVVVNNAELFERRNHLPALLLPILLALLPHGLVPDPAFMGLFFVLWALRRIWSLQGRMNVLGTLVDAGLLLGLAALFYLPYAFLVVVAWASLAVMRPFHWREYLMPLLGAAAVFVLAWGGWHLFAPQAWSPVGSLRSPDPSPWAIGHGHWMYGVVLVVVMGIMVLAGVYSFTALYRHSIMREKNVRSSFLALVFAVGLLAVFAWLIDGRVPPVLLAMPLAVLLSYPLLRARQVAWAEAGLWALLLLAIWARWMG